MARTERSKEAVSVFHESIEVPYKRLSMSIGEEIIGSLDTCQGGKGHCGCVDESPSIVDEVWPHCL